MTTARLTLVELEREECIELLAAGDLGRLGVVVNGRPEIFPVRHGFDHERGTVFFATTEGTKLHAALDWPWVAFEVDASDDDRAGGWSVLLVGRAEEVVEASEIDRLVSLRPGLWEPGGPTHWLRLLPDKITGRRVRV
jgi:nitroimidazol reductase NimA-like FMN-containing flavoprotein (pyridoxamine 5'-phosphate oxidase superfamily)